MTSYQPCCTIALFQGRLVNGEISHVHSQKCPCVYNFVSLFARSSGTPKKAKVSSSHMFPLSLYGSSYERFPFQWAFPFVPSPFSSPNPTEHHRHPPAVCRRRDVKKNRLGCESFSQGASSLTAFDVSRLYYNAQRATPPLSTAPQRKRSRRQRSQSALHVGPPVGKAARVFALTRLECNSFWNLIVSLPILSHEKMKKGIGVRRPAASKTCQSLGKGI